MGKGEIAHYEQFLLFPQCFQKACFPGASKGVIVWEWVNYYFCYMVEASAPIIASLEFSLQALHKIFFSKPLVAFPHNIVETMTNDERGMNRVAMTITNLWKEYLPGIELSTSCSQVL